MHLAVRVAGLRCWANGRVACKMENRRIRGREPLAMNVRSGNPSDPEHHDVGARPIGAIGRCPAASGDTAIIAATGLRNPCTQLERIRTGLIKATLERDPDRNVIRKADSFVQRWVASDTPSGLLAISAGGTQVSAVSRIISRPTGQERPVAPPRHRFGAHDGHACRWR